MPARPLIHPRRQRLVLVAGRALGQDEAAVAVGAVDEIVFAHFQIDARMTQGAADPGAGDAAGAHRE